MTRRKKEWYKRGSWWERLRLNRKYKDRLFRFLFRNKKDLLELYNALNGTYYNDPDNLEIVTMEDQLELYLSDSYAGGRGSGCLECRCRVLNINRGHNGELVKRCRRLWEYSEFVSEVSEWLQKGKAREEAIQLAMDYCIKENILRDILERQRTEVLHMLLTEFDEKKYKRTIYLDGYEDGEQAGYNKGEQALLWSLIQKKRKKGKSLQQIAEELEEDVERIRETIEKMQS